MRKHLYYIVIAVDCNCSVKRIRMFFLQVLVFCAEIIVF